MSVEMVEVKRGNLVESVHRGDLVVTDSKGRVVYELGNADRLTYFRSSAKPLMAIAALEAGIVEKFGLELNEIAIIASSHSGEKEHISVIQSLIKKTGIRYEDLECGSQEPIGKNAAKELIKEGKEPSKLHCNCSAKHIGVAATAVLKGYNIKGYSSMEHPVQKEIDRVLADFCVLDESRIIKASDGCGMPVYAVPLKNMALAYANLCDKSFKDGKYAKSQNYVLSAMSMYPEMVSGKGRFDYELMSKLGDRIIGKFGAEGIYCLGLPERGIGMALKIEDGSNRAVSPVIMEALLQMNIITEDEATRMKEYWKPDVLNTRGEKAGEIRSRIRLS